ncbi:hypothetical protein WUBG_01632 [Wuchereria bancrofti]|uniref:Uncharacterized protein n=1 Tax=Wuchereria bancrofti TaxID=6293 RepID=J9BJ61_WUCBA|nr:hypothetical protein WUBG_01632 [Wuchereria bancrofti]
MKRKAVSVKDEKQTGMTVPVVSEIQRMFRHLSPLERINLDKVDPNCKVDFEKYTTTNWNILAVVVEYNLATTGIKVLQGFLLGIEVKRQRMQGGGLERNLPAVW